MLGMSLSAGRGLSGPIYSVDEVREQYCILILISDIETWISA